MFAMGDSVELSKIASALEISEKDAERIIQNLSDRYKNENSGLQIIELDGAYQMCTKISQYEYLIRIARQPKKHVLTDVLLETLSIVAYKQPVTRVEIEKIRGVSCEHAINRLVGNTTSIRGGGQAGCPGAANPVWDHRGVPALFRRTVGG